MGRSPKRSRGEFLDGLQLDDRLLRKSLRKTGQPALLGGFDADGDPVLVKSWPRQKNIDDSDLQEIWRNEVRQLHRLGGYPGAAKTIAPLYQAGMDSAGFYLVLKPGQRQPLATILSQTRADHWIKNPRSPMNRARLWRNLLQIVAGLETLHAQGLLHRNIDEWAILTTGAVDIDFQLTGFEWSLRLVNAASTTEASSGSTAEPTAPASFLADWKALGILIAGLLLIDVRRLQDPRIPASRVAEYLSAEEIRLLRNLLQVEPLNRLDGEVVAGRVGSIMASLQAEIAGKDPRLYIVARLGTGSSLSERIRESFDGDIEISAIDEQLNAIADDVSDSPLLLAIRTTGDSYRLALQGKKLLYSLSAYAPRGGGEPTWDLAFCDRADRQSPVSTNLLGQIAIQSNSIEIMTARDAATRFGRLRGKLTSWDELRNRFSDKAEKPTREERLHQAIALTQFLEALFAAADAYPVEVVEQTDLVQDGSYEVSLRLRSDPERDALSAALQMQGPALRIDEVLRDDRRTDEWILTEARQVGERQITDTSWRFARKDEAGSQPATYIFEGASPPPPLNHPVLIPGDFVGRDIQFRRRLKALQALAEHAELLGMLVDPRRRILDSHDEIQKDEAFSQLDESKQQALGSVVTTLPLFLIQGPPGVGKTRLVRDLVRDTFRTDATARLLLSAQSNAAVDHLLDELHGALSQTDSDVLIVRCRPRDRNEDSGPYEIGRQAQTLLSRLAKSDLVAKSPPHLRKTLLDMNLEPSGQRGRPRGATSTPYVKQAFEGLVVRAANVVFATTNSFELERLIDERGQFDWAIVEEAGKATGGELLSPLLLSHRRLMIGDHKQLAPFNSGNIIRLLEQPDVVREALKAGQEFIARALRDPSTDEVLDEIEEASVDFPALCTTAIECLILFERLIEAEFSAQKRKQGIRPIAHRLTQQHRMHPAIARVVSRAFYNGDLHTHPSAEERFRTKPSPLTAGKLAGVPITVVDMPYIQKTVGIREAEREPRWHNPDEIEAIATVLKNLHPGVDQSTPPTLAVLSPYSEQVKRLRRRIDENLAEFPNLSGFRPAIGADEYCGTVDSFQGNEADIVVVSFVRNNHHSSVRSALGFLSDSRRMNVLLSRARWRMVLVGSLDFLRAVLKSAEKTNKAADVSFLSRFLVALSAEQQKGAAVIIPVGELGDASP